ncbi:hypothetical protein E8E14_014811 [Neopestalotiopsis sp. 37M]|nr:hypothetical protein E8E14_014811 [Neopestalotiopsis sp. 37M]
MIPSTQLDGVALVVGSGRGIGRDTAFSLAEAGARVVVFADMDLRTAETSSEESRKFATHKDYQTRVFEMNVQDEKSVQAMVDFVIEEFGRLDYAINVAGIGDGVHVPVAETDMQNFDSVMNINTRGNLLCVKAQVRAMRRQTPKTWSSRNGERDIGRGVIINLGSANSYVGMPHKASYTVSKHASLAVTKTAAMDHAAEGIRVNAVCPSWVRTPMLDEELKQNPEVKDMIGAIVPIKRAAECDEVSDTIAFLCSPAASYINGTGLIIDAGSTTTVRLF